MIIANIYCVSMF